MSDRYPEENYPDDLTGAQVEALFVLREWAKRLDAPEQVMVNGYYDTYPEHAVADYAAACNMSKPLTTAITERISAELCPKCANLTVRRRTPDHPGDDACRLDLDFNDVIEGCQLYCPEWISEC